MSNNDIVNPSIIYVNSIVDKDFIINLFNKFSSKYGKLWTERLGPNGDWKVCLDDWHEELSKFTVEQVNEAKTKCFLIHKQFPPSQPEFIDLCLKESGVPYVHEVVRMMVNKDFSHPVVKLIYDKIGSWKMSNGSEKEIADKAACFYQDALNDFDKNKEYHWQRLQDFKDMDVKSLPAPDKIPSKQESAAFRECMNKCQEILQGKGIPGKTHKEFDEDAISPTNRGFDPIVYAEFCEYLLSIPETETMILPPSYAYRRHKVIAAKEQPEFLRKAGYSPDPQGQDCDQGRGQNRPSRMYRNYTGD